MRALIVDDDPKLRGFVQRGLRVHGIESEATASAEEAAERVAKPGDFDVILLDVLMAGRSGWEFLSDIRGRGDATPVLFVTARRTLDDRVHGLHLGADDYIVKPFALEELVARMKAVVRRSARAARLRVGDLCMDLDRRTVDRDGHRIELSPREFDVLRALAAARGRVVTRAELLRDVWGIRFDPETNLVDSVVARLRRRVDRVPPPLVETVVGEGYRLAVDEDAR